MADVDKELFDAAMADNPPEPVEAPQEAEPVQEAPAEPAPSEPHRDELGRFARAEEPKPAPAPVETPQQDRRVPLAEHLQTRERAQAAERERDEMSKRFAEMERRIAELSYQRQQQQPVQHPQQPQPAPDFFADPEAAVRNVVMQLLAPVQQSQHAQNVAVTKSLAAQQHGLDKVDAAEKAFMDEVYAGRIAQNSPEYIRVVNSPNMFDAAVKWHQERSILAEIGTDPEAYRARIRAELLKDQAFQSEAMTAWRAQAQGGNAQPGKPNTVTRLPSLNRQTSAADNHSDADEPKTDKELLNWALRR